MKTWEKMAITGMIGLAGLVAKCEYDDVPIQGKVVREYGSPMDGNYGFELRSDRGRTVFVSFDPSGRGGKEELIALSEGVKEGSLIKFIRGLKEKRNPAEGPKFLHDASYPTDVVILNR